jgi:hypothetical protein
MKPRIVIVMDGGLTRGLIRHILGNTADVEIALIDYEVESADEETLIAIPQEDKIGVPVPTYEQAYCWTMNGPDEVNPSRVDELFATIAGSDKQAEDEMERARR